MNDSDSSSLHFSEDDIRTQLELLGYHNVPRHQLRQFAADLERLIANESNDQQYDDEESVASDLSSNVPPEHLTRPANIQQRDQRETFRPDYYKHHMPVHRDHTKYGKENYTYDDYRSDMSPPTYKPTRDQADPHHREYLDSSMASSRSDDPQRQPWWPPPEKKAPMKRKVLRKKGGQSQVFDESISITESEADDISYLNEHLHGMPMPSQDDQDSASVVTESDASSIVHHVTSSRRRRPVSASALYSHRPSGDDDTVYKPHLPRSFIRPDSAQPKSRHKGHDPKTDPVTRHQMYQAAWNAKKAPGEKSRKDLRWNVREQMMYKDEPTKPQNQPRVYVPNSYKVPTDKKRQALRWAVRTTLAKKQMPYTSFEF